MENSNLKLLKIAEKYAARNFDKSNYSLGGGLVNEKFASVRHESAKRDFGKLTVGEATQMLKKATGENLEIVKAVIKFRVPSPEYHHAGRLPRAYGGGMKKTYFLNSFEIVDIARNFYELKDKAIDFYCLPRT